MPTEGQVAGGHKANLKNPNTSKESKENSKKILENEFNGGDGKMLSLPSEANRMGKQIKGQERG